MSNAGSIHSWISDNTFVRYLYGLLGCVVALLAGSAVVPVAGDHVLFVMLLPAVAFSSLFCGVGPSILAIVLSLIGMKYWLIPPVHSLRLSSPQSVGILVFLLASGVIVAMGATRSRKHLALCQAQKELGEQVKERTSELDTANRSLRQLTARLLQLQDEERRRFARELHDSVGQTLAALSMNLSAVRTDIDRMIKTSSQLEDSEALVQEMSREIRTISHLLHPPLLDEAGLSAALRWYVEGFAERSNVEVELDIPEDFGRLPQELETAIFRTVQECLTNIHRHSESPIARIHLAHSKGDVRIQVEDTGKGISQERQNELASIGIPGVGLRGMRERLQQLGGSLKINSDSKGTVVMASLPVPDASSAAA